MCDGAARYMPRARKREVLHECSDAQVAVERTWSSEESLLLPVSLTLFPYKKKLYEPQKN